MRSIAYCGGTFDLFHPGHVRFFEWVKARFGFVVVSLNSDSFVKRYKGVEPIQSLPERWEMVSGCRFVDQVVENVRDEDSKPTILLVKPTHIVNGSDWCRDRLMSQMGLTESFLSERGITISLCQLPRQFSSTELKERIRA